MAAATSCQDADQLKKINQMVRLAVAWKRAQARLGWYFGVSFRIIYFSFYYIIIYIIRRPRVGCCDL